MTSKDKCRGMSSINSYSSKIDARAGVWKKTTEEAKRLDGKTFNYRGGILTSNSHSKMNEQLLKSMDGWRERGSASQNIDVVYNKDDSKYKTCDSITLVKYNSSSTRERCPSGSQRSYSINKPSGEHKINFSQKSIINSIENMTRRSVNFQLKKPSSEKNKAPDNNNVYQRLSSKSNHFSFASTSFFSINSHLHQSSTFMPKRPSSRDMRPLSNNNVLSSKDMMMINGSIIQSNIDLNSKISNSRKCIETKKTTGNIIDKCLSNDIDIDGILDDGEERIKGDGDKYYVSELVYYTSHHDDTYSPVYKDHVQLSLNSIRFSRIIDIDAINEFMDKNRVFLSNEDESILV